MTTQIQKIAMCRLNTDRLTSVTPTGMFTSQAAWAWPNKKHSPRLIQSFGCRDIAGSPYGSCYPADRFVPPKFGCPGPEACPGDTRHFPIRPICSGYATETTQWPILRLHAQSDCTQYPYAWEYRQRLPTRNSRAVDGRFGPARAVAFVLFHATNVHQSQAHLQGDQRPGSGMPAPDDPEQVACQEAPETDSPTAGPQRAEQPCRDYRHHHRRPLQQVDPIHIASNEAGACCPVKVGAVALRRVPKHPAGHGGRKTRVRFHATKPERICPPDATAWMAAASRPASHAYSRLICCPGGAKRLQSSP